MNDVILPFITKIYPLVMVSLTFLLIYYFYTNRDYVFRKGFKLIREGRYRMALDDFSKDLETQNDITSILYGIGYCYFMLGNNEEAIKNYEKAIKLNSNQIEIYLQLAILYSNKRNFETAFKFINKLVEQQKKVFFLYRKRKFQVNEIKGWIYYEKGEIDNSLTHYNFSIPRYKLHFKTNYFKYLEKFSPIYYRIGTIYKLKNETKKAKKYFENSIKSSPNSIFAEMSKEELDRIKKSL